MSAISGISNYSNYQSYLSGNVSADTGNQAYVSGNASATAGNGSYAASDTASHVTLNPGESDVVSAGRKSSPAECETCKNRKYKDGSDEMVSFKSAAHISTQASASRVRAHEQEHVSNAYKKAAMGNGQVVSASVSLQTAICPECGTTYTAGGTTTTQIRYENESNPYQQNQKSLDAANLIGQSLNLAV